MEIELRMFIKFLRMVISLEIHGSWFIRIELNARMMIYLEIHARLFFKLKIWLKILWRTFIRMKLNVRMVIQIHARFFRTDHKKVGYNLGHRSAVLIEVQGVENKVFFLWGLLLLVHE